MSETIDILATTNPGYCSLVLLSFVDAYIKAAGVEPNFTLAYLAVPIAMSSSVNSRFEGTNVRTGLLEWVNRNPELRLELPQLLRQAVPIVRSAIIFGLQTGIFELTPDGGLRAHWDRVKSKPKDPARAEITRRHHGAARSFGTWCGHARSASTIFMSLGVTL